MDAYLRQNALPVAVHVKRQRRMPATYIACCTHHRPFSRYTLHNPVCKPFLQELKGTAAYDKMKGRVQRPADAPTRMRQLWSEVAKPFIQENPQLRLPTGTLTPALLTCPCIALLHVAYLPVQESLASSGAAW